MDKLSRLKYSKRPLHRLEMFSNCLIIYIYYLQKILNLIFHLVNLLSQVILFFLYFYKSSLKKENNEGIETTEEDK